MCVYVYVYMFKYIYTYTYIYIYGIIRTYIQYIHTRIHTHIHTHRAHNFSQYSMVRSRNQTDVFEFISQVSRYHAHPRNAIYMFIIRGAEYFQYSVLYINLGIFVEIGSRSSSRTVAHSEKMFSLHCIYSLCFLRLNIKTFSLTLHRNT
jgi:hypothetical protein